MTSELSVGELYNDFAEYYDLWTSMIPATHTDLHFYLDRARHAADTGTLVELGVGNGRIAIALAAEGFHVTGVDLSTAMLAAAAKKAEEAGVRERIELVEADFVDWRPSHLGVALVYSPYHTLSHVTDAKRWAPLFANVLSYLEPGGRFCFNLIAPNRDELDAIDGATRELGRIPLGDGEAFVTTTTVHDWKKRWARTSVHGELWADYEIVLVKDFSFTSRISTIDEVRDLSEAAGFEIEDLSGSFVEPSAPVSNEQIWTLRKPG